MHAQFQILRQPELAGSAKATTAKSSSNCRGEIGHVADVIDPFVEAAGEPRGDRLRRNPLVGDRGEDQQQFAGVCGLAVSSSETSITGDSPGLAS